MVYASQLAMEAVSPESHIDGTLSPISSNLLQYPDRVSPFDCPRLSLGGAGTSVSPLLPLLGLPCEPARGTEVSGLYQVRGNLPAKCHPSEPRLHLTLYQPYCDLVPPFVRYFNWKCSVYVLFLSIARLIRCPVCAHRRRHQQSRTEGNG